MTHSKAPKLPPSILPRPELIKRWALGRSRTRCSILRAAPLSGKTTLLAQIAEHQSRRAKIIWVDGNTAEFQATLNAAHKEETLLCVDRADAIEITSEDAEKLVMRVDRLRIVVACEHFAKSIQTRVLDFHVIQNLQDQKPFFFSENEIAELLRLLDLPQEFSQPLRIRTNGQPWLVQASIAKMISEKETWNEPRISEAIHLVQSKFAELILERQSPDTQRAIAEASQYVYFFDGAHRAIQSIESETRDNLYELHLFTKTGHPVTPALKSLQNRAFIGAIPASNSPRALMEQIWRERAKDPDACVRLLNENFEIIQKSSTTNELIAITEPFRDLLSPKFLSERAYALSQDYQVPKALSEIETRLLNTKSLKEKVVLRAMMIRILRIADRVPEASKQINFLLNDAKSLDSSSRAIALREALLTARYDRKAREQYLTSLEQIPSDTLPKRILADIHWAHGLVAQTDLKSETSRHHYEQALEYFIELGRFIDEIWIRINIASTDIAFRGTLLSIEEGQELLRRAKETGNRRLTIELLELLSITFSYQGRFEDADQLFSHNLSGSPDNPNYRRVYFQKAFNEFERGQIYSALELVEKLMSVSTSWQFQGLYKTYLATWKLLPITIHHTSLLERVARDISTQEGAELTYSTINYLQCLHRSWWPFRSSKLLKPAPSPDPAYNVRYQALIGTEAILFGKTREGLGLLEAANTAALRNQMNYWSAICEQGLALGELVFGQVSKARARVTQARHLLQTCQANVDVTWLDAIEAVCDHKDGKQEAITNLKSESPGFQQWCDRVFAILDVSRARKLRITTYQGSQTRELRYQDLQFPNLELLVDSANGILKSNQRELRRSDHPILFNLSEILIRMIGRDVSKEELTVRIWAERYNPDIHDPRIYSAVHKLREFIGDTKGTTLQASAGGYRFRANLAFGRVDVEIPKGSLSEHHRWIMRFVQSSGTVDNRTIVSGLKINRVKAKRLATDLVERGFLRLMGRGRSAHYVRS